MGRGEQADGDPVQLAGRSVPVQLGGSPANGDRAIYTGEIKWKDGAEDRQSSKNDIDSLNNFDPANDITAESGKMFIGPLWKLFQKLEKDRQKIIYCKPDGRVLADDADEKTQGEIDPR